MNKTFTLDKTGWPLGEWTEEADTARWKDESTGLDCAVLRTKDIGHLCGYVGVTEPHPLFGQDYNRCPINCGGDWCEHQPQSLLEAHGGITFSGLLEDAPRVWWFGFDCAHGGDFCPGLQRYGFIRGSKDVYRNASFVMEECAKLAAQVSAYELPSLKEPK